MVNLKTIATLFLIIGAVIFGIRIITPEDSWQCQNGIWVRHGSPNTPQPTTTCEK